MISIIIPTHNRKTLLLETLFSVSLQDYRPLEVIIVDDGSTDSTDEAVFAWIAEQKDKSTIYYRYVSISKSNGSRARNVGINHAEGEFLLFLDSDDLIGTNHVSSLATELAKHDCKTAVYSKWSFFRIINSQWYAFPAPPMPSSENQLNDWLSGWFLSPPSILWRKRDILMIGMWDERLTADQDGDIAMQFLARGGKFVSITGGHAFYRLHDTPGSSVAASRTRASNRSRLRVIYKIERLLAASGRLEMHQSALSTRYARLAISSSSSDPETSSLAFRLCQRISKGRIPNIVTQKWLVSILGLQSKLRLMRFIRAALRLKPKQSYTHTMVPTSVHQSIYSMISSYTIPEQH